MARKKSRLVIDAEYYSLRGLLSVLQLLPFSISRTVCRRLLQGIIAILPRRRRLVLSQLAACFPDATGDSLKLLARRSLEALADGIAAFARISRLGDGEVDRWVTSEGFEHLRAALAQGRGVITFSAHTGCWEMMAAHLTRTCPGVSMLVRPLDNPKLDALVAGVRRSGGGGVINSHRILKDGLRVLRKNGILGILMDQNFYKGGVFVNFFGRLAATSTLVPILARRTGAVVLPLHNVWRDGKVHVICESPVRLSDHPDPDVAIAEDTQMLTDVVERWVRTDPSQWLWLHNRWKRRPQPGDPVYSRAAGLMFRGPTLLPDTSS
jgi:KDO2-lipid IV(A) lauroyltransferase